MKFTHQKEKIAALEALLFIYGEPMTEAKIEKVLGIARDEIPGLVAILGESYASEDRGLTILTEGDYIQLVTKPVFGSVIAEFLKEEMREELTPAALETLSLVAYCGPLSRAKIDYIRGVNSSVILRNLRIRGLIDRNPDPASAMSYRYAPSAKFMRHLGVTKKEALPDYEKFSKLLLEAEPTAIENESEAG